MKETDPLEDLDGDGSMILKNRMGRCGLEAIDNWRADAVKMVMNTDDPYKAGLFLSILGNISFPSILLHGVICLLFFLGSGTTYAASFTVYFAWQR